MANATSGHTYAQIVNGLVHWIFGMSDLPEWNGDQITVVDITGVSPAPTRGWLYNGVTFSPSPPPPPPTLAQQAAALLATGIAITSMATTALDATYSASATAQAQINAEVTSILLNGTFADGTSTIDWLDVSGVSHTFTIAQFKLLATKIAIFVSGCVKCVNGQTTVLPNTSATIL